MKDQIADSADDAAEEAVAESPKIKELIDNLDELKRQESDDQSKIRNLQSSLADEKQLVADLANDNLDLSKRYNAHLCQFHGIC